MKYYQQNTLLLEKQMNQSYGRVNAPYGTLTRA